jgi:hypothetical protein
MAAPAVDMDVVFDEGKQEARSERLEAMEQTDAFEFMSEEYMQPNSSSSSSSSGPSSSSSASSSSGRSRSRGRSASTPKASDRVGSAAPMVSEQVEAATTKTAPTSSRKRRAAASVEESASQPSVPAVLTVSSLPSAASIVEEAKNLRLKPKETNVSSSMAALSSAMPPPAKKGRTALAAAKARALTDLSDLGGSSNSGQVEKENVTSLGSAPNAAVTSRRAAIAAASKVAAEPEDSTASFDSLFKVLCNFRLFFLDSFILTICNH